MLIGGREVWLGIFEETLDADIGDLLYDLSDKERKFAEEEDEGSFLWGLCKPRGEESEFFMIEEGGVMSAGEGRVSFARRALAMGEPEVLRLLLIGSVIVDIGGSLIMLEPMMDGCGRGGLSNVYQSMPQLIFVNIVGS